MITEQPNPVRGVQDVHDLAVEHAIETMNRQHAKGIEKYGQPLLTFNGRDTVRDIREELADVHKYIEVLIQQHNQMRQMLFELYYDVSSARDYVEEHYHEDIVEFVKSNE